MLFGQKKNKNLSHLYTDKGIEYTFNGDAPPDFPLNSNSNQILSKLLPQGETWSALDTLWADGLVEPKENGRWIVPYKVYAHYDEQENEDLFNSLAIPAPEPLRLEVKTSSHVGDEKFKINVEASHPDYGPLREGDPPRYDRVFFLSDKLIVPLTNNAADLFEAAKGEDLQSHEIEEHMRYLASTKKAALKAEAKIDPYLEKEDYEFRTEAGLDLDEIAPDEVQLVPQIDGLGEYDSDAQTLIDEPERIAFTKVDSGGRRKRMVLDRNLREQISQLPKDGKITGANVPRLLTQPETILPEGFDLSQFSQRVKGIRTKVYNSRPYLHVKKTKGGWFEGIPGIKLDDWSPADNDAGDGEQPGQAYKKKPDNLSEETYKKLAEKAKETGDEYVLHEGNWVRVDPDLADKFENTIEQLKQDDGTLKIPAGSILEIYENLELLEFIDKEELPQEEQLLPDDLPDVDLPADFNGELFPYQTDGYRWLSRLNQHLIGGLLADEMGLGKTVQAISHILKLKENGVAGPHLVVVPKSLIENWTREIDHFSDGTLSAYPYDGPGRQFGKQFFKNFDVVLSTYDTLRRDQAKLATINWNMVICDEAQYAKNPTTQRTCALKALKSKHRAALTGTPVENGLIEFWCIMDFVQPGLLGSWADFRKDYERPIIEEQGVGRDNKIKELLSKIKGYYLRRLKETALKLPPKNSVIKETELSEYQLELYKKIARQAKAGGRGAMLAGIGKLLRLCAHPSAVIDSPSLDSNQLDRCPKLKATLEIIEDIKNRGEKAIIFSDFKKIQRVLQRAIRDTFGTWPDIINGEITNNRQAIIDIFSEKQGFNVIILGHQVAGVGLNITKANHVIHYTRPWNPAKENQATDRVHRIGQEKEVCVYYPIVKNEQFKTVEERLDELLSSKAQLAQDVLRPTKEMQVKTEELFECIDDAS